MAVPVKGIRVSAYHSDRRWMTFQAMLPEDRLLRFLEMWLIPNVPFQLTPVGMPWVQVRLVDLEPFRIDISNKLGLARHREHMSRICRFTQSHIVISPYRIVEWFEIHILCDIEVHAASDILHHQTVASGDSLPEVNIPHVRTYQVLLTCLLLISTVRLPELHGTHLFLLVAVHLIEVNFLTLPGMIVTGAAISQPLVEVGSHIALCGMVTNDIDMHSLRLRVPYIKQHRGCLLVGIHAFGNGHLIRTTLSHGTRELQEQPMVQFTGQRMVGIHGFRLPPNHLRALFLERLVILGSDQPLAGFLCHLSVQPLAKDKQSIITLFERMTQISTLTRAIIPIMHLSIPELYHQIVLVNDFQSYQFRGKCRNRQHQ